MPQPALETGALGRALRLALLQQVRGVDGIDLQKLTEGDSSRAGRSRGFIAAQEKVIRILRFLQYYHRNTSALGLNACCNRAQRGFEFRAH
jgi:hypothetical protein